MSSLWHLDRPYMSLYLLPTFVFLCTALSTVLGTLPPMVAALSTVLGTLPPIVTALSTVLGTCRLWLQRLALIALHPVRYSVCKLVVRFTRPTKVQCWVLSYVAPSHSASELSARYRQGLHARLRRSVQCWVLCRLWLLH